MRFVIPCLAACVMLSTTPSLAQSSDASSSTATSPVSGQYSTATTPIGTLIDDPASKAVLMAHMPEVVTNPQMAQARPLTLKALQSYAPYITDAMLAAIDADLAKLPTKQVSP